MKAMPTRDRKHVGIWIRKTRRGASPEHHETRGRMAESLDWLVVEVFNLAGVSGKSVVDQPETARMLADMRAGRITRLIFSKLARHARNTRELLDFADWFKAASAELISLEEMIDTSTPAGRLFLHRHRRYGDVGGEEIGSRPLRRGTREARQDARRRGALWLPLQRHPASAQSR